MLLRWLCPPRTAAAPWEDQWCSRSKQLLQKAFVDVKIGVMFISSMVLQWIITFSSYQQNDQKCMKPIKCNWLPGNPQPSPYIYIYIYIYLFIYLQYTYIYIHTQHIYIYIYVIFYCTWIYKWIFPQNGRSFSEWSFPQMPWFGESSVWTLPRFFKATSDAKDWTRSAKGCTGAMGVETTETSGFCLTGLLQEGAI